MTDFSVPQRMSAAAFIIILMKNLKNVFGMFVVVTIVRMFDDGFSIPDKDMLLRFLITLGTLIVIAMMMAISSYFPKKFCIQNGSLIFRHGIIRRETTTIPLSRIHTLRTRQGILYQILGVRGIAFDTLASKTEEVELILDETDWQTLLRLIDKEENPPSDALSDAGILTPPSKSSIRFKNSDLMLDALCQNHLKGASILLGFLALCYERISDFYDNAAETISSYAAEYTEYITTSHVPPVMIVAILAAVYMIVLILWLGKVFMRYFDMILTHDRTLLSFCYGLLSRSSCRFAFNKVCTIWVKRNFFEKKLHLSTLMLRQAFNVTAGKEEDNLKIYGIDNSEFYLRWWLGNGYRQSPEIMNARSGKGVMIRIILIDFAVSTAVALALCYFRLYAWLFLPATYFVFSWIKGVCAMRHSRISLLESYIVIHNGRLADIRNYIKYSNIESVRIRRTPISRISHRVSVVIATPGSSITVRSLAENDAIRIYELLLCKAESTDQGSKIMGE